jgi:enoyl-CoA hydratase/carnithine racemase
MEEWDVHFTAWHQGVEKPVITAVNGLCAGSAFHWVADADIVIAASDAQFFDPHVSVGQVVSLEAIALIRKMPAEAVMRMAFVGKYERMPAERALQLGMISEIVDPPDCVSGPGDGRDHREELARCLAATKKALWAHSSWGSPMRAERGGALVDVWVTPIRRRDPRFEKRPRWAGSPAPATTGMSRTDISARQSPRRSRREPRRLLSTIPPATTSRCCTTSAGRTAGERERTSRRSTSSDRTTLRRGSRLDRGPRWCSQRRPSGADAVLADHPRLPDAATLKTSTSSDPLRSTPPASTQCPDATRYDDGVAFLLWTSSRRAPEAGPAPTTATSRSSTACSVRCGRAAPTVSAVLAEPHPRLDGLNAGITTLFGLRRRAARADGSLRHHRLHNARRGTRSARRSSLPRWPC